MVEKRLLMVDDEPELGEVVRMVAEDLGYEVRITNHGEAFMHAVENFQPTTVLVDIHMPEIDGIELVQWLKARNFEEKIFVMSGSRDVFATMAQALGDAHGLTVSVIEKPFRVATLRDALQPCAS